MRPSRPRQRIVDIRAQRIAGAPAPHDTTRSGRSRPRRAAPARLIRIPDAPHRSLHRPLRWRDGTLPPLELLGPRSPRPDAASSSGLRLDDVEMRSSDLVNWLALAQPRYRRASLPMMTPGRAAWIVTRHFLCGRSMTTRLTPACRAFFLMNSRILRSSSAVAVILVSANQRLSQVRLTWRAKPDGVDLLTHYALLAHGP